MDSSESSKAGGPWDRVHELRRAGRPAEALAALEAGAAADGDPDRAMRRLRALLVADLALERETAGDWEGAERLLVEAVADAPRFPDLHHRLGMARLARGGRAEARAAFT